MLKFMLDTDISIYVIKRRPPELMDIFNQHDEQLAISSITLSELLHGVEKSANPQKKQNECREVYQSSGGAGLCL